LLQPTIALIAFQQYWSNESKMNSNLTTKDHAVTTTSLGATIASLVQVGMGRVLVVGYEPSDEAVVRDSFRLLNANCQDARVADGESNNRQRACRVHGSELVYVQATDDLVRSKFIPVNMPRAALAGLMWALHESNTRSTTSQDSEGTRQWLGEDPARWRYVYLTEPDTILQTRPSTLWHLKRAMDLGHILSPHRFQPLPHQDDAAHSGTPHLIPNDFKTPWVLNSVDDHTGSCCDAQEGDHKPGRSNLDSCGDFWWLCGYGHGHGGNHSRLAGYEFLRLSHGTGIVTLAGNEHGRRCIPSVGGTSCQYRSAR
jgi:hypothetical protein